MLKIKKVLNRLTEYRNFFVLFSEASVTNDGNSNFGRLLKSWVYQKVILFSLAKII